MLEATLPSTTSSRVRRPAARDGALKRPSSSKAACRARASKWGGSTKGSPAVGGIIVGMTQAHTISASWRRPSTIACSSAPFANSEKSVGHRIRRIATIFDLRSEAARIAESGQQDSLVIAVYPAREG